MTRNRFPAIALAVSVMLGLALLLGSGATPLPLLTRLFICEFGMLVNLGGAYFGYAAYRADSAKKIAALLALLCAMLAIAFAVLGVDLWQSMQLTG